MAKRQRLAKRLAKRLTRVLVTWLMVFGLFGLAGVGASAHADSDSDSDTDSDSGVLVLVSPPDTDTATDKDKHSQVVAAVVKAVAFQHWSATVAEPAVASLGNKLGKCLTAADEDKGNTCVARQVRKITSPTILWLRADRSTDDEGEPRVVLYGRLMDQKSGQTLFTTERHCVRCHEHSRVVALADEIATELIRDRAHQLAPHTALKVIATPGDALIDFGELPAGPAGSTYRVPPGPLKVTIHKPGFRSVEKLVDMRPNQELLLEVELQSTTAVEPAHGDDTHKKPRPYERSVWPWIVGGSGVASLGLGVTWMVRHQDAVENGARLPRRRNSMTRGIVAASVGAALIGASGVLWYRDRAREKQSRILVAPTPEGAVVTWSGRF